MAKINGTNMLVVVDGVKIGATKTFTLNIDVNLPDASSKDSSGWGENIHGQRTWSVDFDGLYDPTLTYNLEEIFDDIDNRDEDLIVEIANIDGTGGGLCFRGYAKIASLSMSGEMENTTTFSGRFVGHGDLNKTTVVAS